MTTTKPDRPVSETSRITTKIHAPGDQLGDFYRIEGSVEGGMGIVYFVKDWRFDRKLVLKTIRPDVTIDPECVSRFNREAECWLTLAPHDNVVELITIDRIDQVLHILSEFEDGGPLEEWILPSRPLKDRIRIAYEIAQGMSHVHKAGLLHRDLKPANIFLTKEGRAKVGDFGLARSTATPEQLKKLGAFSWKTGESITVRGTVVGTPSYMAPEMWYEGAKVGFPADIYAYGVMLFELFLNIKPFPIDFSLDPLARYEAMRKLHVTMKPAIPESAPIPAPLKQLILDCLAKQPGFRPLSFDLVVPRLRQIMSDLGVQETQIKKKAAEPANELHFYRGLAWSTLGHLPKAIEEYSAALKGNPKLAEALVNRGRAYKALNRLQEAYDDLSDAIHMRPEFALAYTHRGAVRHAAGDVAGAEADYAAALKLRPHDPETLLNRSVLRLQRGDVRDATSDLDAIINERPTHAPAFNSRGLTRKKMGDFTGALEDFNKALSINPAYANAVYNRGCVRAEKQDLHGAIEDFSTASCLDPADFMARYNRASIQLEMEDFKSARPSFEECVALDPKHPPSRFGLGFSLLQLGEKASAAEHLKRFLELAPKHQLADQAEKLLKACGS